MRQVELSIQKADDAAPATAQITLEGKRGQEWVVLKRWLVAAGTPAATRKVLVLDGERLIVEEVPRNRVVYDKEHNVVSIEKDEVDDGTSGL